MTSLTAHQHATLAAFAARVVPHAFVDPARGARLMADVVARIEALPSPARRDLGRALWLLGSRVASLVGGEGIRPFERQGALAQDRLLDRWTTSRFDAVRAAVQAFRRIILLAEYATPEAEEEVGYRGPLHKRTKVVDWEDAPRAPAPVAFAPSVVDGSVLTADAVVIGSGAGGAVAAARLAEAGLEVIILESGPLIAGEGFDESQGPSHRRLYADGGLRATDDASLAILQGAVAGGGTAVNWMAMLRTPDRVLEEWRLRYGTEGMSPREMHALFDRIEQETHTHLVDDADHSPNNRIILDGARALGFRAHASKINAKGCVRAGFCGQGCRYGAKQDVLRTYLPRAIAAGARLFTETQALEIAFVERGGAFPKKRVMARHRAASDGGHAPARRIVIEAPIVVLAAGAVETPALLERSALGGGGVGRFLRVHPTSGLLALYDREIYGAAGIPLSAVCDQFDGREHGGYGTWIECPPLHPALAAAALPSYGTAHREVMREFPRIGSLIVLTRDGADRDVSSGEVRARHRDPDSGISIRCRLSAKDAAHLEEGLVGAARLHFAAGATEVISGHASPVVMHSEKDIDLLRGRSMAPNAIALFSAHLNGTCRIGKDPRTAGCDPNGQRYGAPGVFVADGSLMPTAPGVNPQETIFALATVVTERIAASWRRR